FQEFLEDLAADTLERLAATLPFRYEAAERLAALAHVRDFDAVFGRTIEWGLRHVLVGNRDAEAGAERPQLVFVHLLLLVRDVLALAGFAESVPFNSTCQNDGGRALEFDRGLVGVVDLDRVVSAERHLLQLVVGQVLDHVQQPRIHTPEVLTYVGARLDSVLLVLAVDDLTHPLHEQPVAILRQNRIPFAAPQDLDHVPASAAERRLELLDDLTVATHRAI